MQMISGVFAFCGFPMLDLLFLDNRVVLTYCFICHWPIYTLAYNRHQDGTCRHQDQVLLGNRLPCD